MSTSINLYVEFLSFFKPSFIVKIFILPRNANKGWKHMQQQPIFSRQANKSTFCPQNELCQWTTKTQQTPWFMHEI